MSHNIEFEMDNIQDYVNRVSNWVSTLSEDDIIEWSETKQCEIYEMYAQWFTL